LNGGSRSATGSTPAKRDLGWGRSHQLRPIQSEIDAAVRTGKSLPYESLSAAGREADVSMRPIPNLRPILILTMARELNT